MSHESGGTVPEAGQYPSPRLQIPAAASDASCGVNGRDWTEHPASSVFARNASSRPRVRYAVSSRSRTYAINRRTRLSLAACLRQGFGEVSPSDSHLPATFPARGRGRRDCYRALVLNGAFGAPRIGAPSRRRADNA